jgi:hypothetical protein
MKRFAFIGVLMATIAGPSHANTIKSACLNSDRAGGNYALCGCIQDAANRTLTTRDQRLAATFFSNPHRAQEIRQSSSRSNASFWERYRNFGNAAETFCRG